MNSNRGSGLAGKGVDRPIRRAGDATAEELRWYAVDASGALVFPATVKEVLADGRLVLGYDHMEEDRLVQDGEGV